LRFIRNLLRIYSYVFEAILSLAALALSLVIAASPRAQIRLGWLPWSSHTIGIWLAGIGLLGVIFVVLAIRGRARILLTLFALAVFLIVTRGFFLSSWRFSGSDELRHSLWLVAGLFLAFLGSIPMSSPRMKVYKGMRS
jgi:hypothetical protein